MCRAFSAHSLSQGRFPGLTARAIECRAFSAPECVPAGKPAAMAGDDRCRFPTAGENVLGLRMRCAGAVVDGRREGYPGLGWMAAWNEQVDAAPRVCQGGCSGVLVGAWRQGKNSNVLWGVGWPGRYAASLSSPAGRALKARHAIARGVSPGTAGHSRPNSPARAAQRALHGQQRPAARGGLDRHVAARGGALYNARSVNHRAAPGGRRCADT